ncbi:uncharacterized protein LOC143596556 [Bidens hawaiensis]|uniref:uncharacterized protein LOC143596556 n=1 Tax=Bidens hawaiensis TaxID=980011 RepID=UPI00404AA97C
MNVNQAQSSRDMVNCTSADKIFISLDFAYIIDKPRDMLSKPFFIEVVDENSIIITTVIWDCVTTLNKVEFRIDLIPMQMGSFDVIVGMDWLTLNRAEVVCFEKFLRIPLKNGRVLNVFAQRYLHKKYVAFVALVVEKEHKEMKISDIPIVRKFSDVFPDDDSGLPPISQIEFCIDLIPGANPVPKAPYRLAPSKMQEHSCQLQELSDKGLILPSSSP